MDPDQELFIGDLPSTLGGDAPGIVRVSDSPTSLWGYDPATTLAIGEEGC